MPTNKPRLMVTVTPEVHSTLKELSRVSGSSMNSFVAAMLRDALPVFRTLIKTFEAAQKSQEQAADNVAAAAVDVILSVKQQALSLENELAGFKIHRTPTSKKGPAGD